MNSPRLLLAPLLLAPGAIAHAGAGEPPVKINFQLVWPQSPGDPPPSWTPAQFAAALLQETNRVRLEHGCRALRDLAELQAAADDQAAYMALTLHMSHSNPDLAQADPLTRVHRRGLHPAVVGENVIEASFATRGEPPRTCAEIAATLVARWMDSPHHRANLLSRDFTCFGGSIRHVIVPGRGDVFYAAQTFARL